MRKHLTEGVKNIENSLRLLTQTPPSKREGKYSLYGKDIIYGNF